MSVAVWPLLAGGRVTLVADQHCDCDWDLLRARLIRMRNFGLRMQASEEGSYDELDRIAWVAWAGSQIEALDEHDHGCV
jgi:hypothetical protein